MGDEGGFAPNLKSNEAALEALMAAIEAAKYKPGEDVVIAIDVAASGMLQDGKYVFKKSDNKARTAEEMIELYAGWVDRYPIVSIEDGLGEDDWDGWAKLTTALGGKIQVVGDDIFVTNMERLGRGIGQDRPFQQHRRGQVFPPLRGGDFRRPTPQFSLKGKIYLLLCSCDTGYS